MSAKLYLVTCRGMHSGLGTSPAYGRCYVIAEDPASAYAAVRADLDKNKIGFTEEREMKSVELLAEAAPYPSCGTRLYAQEQKGDAS